VATALVIGSTGYIGSRLIAQLVRDGHDVIATARDVGKLERFDFASSVRGIQLDAHDAASCRQSFTEATAAAGRVDVVYYLIHSIGDDDFAVEDLQAARNVIAAASAAGAGRVVYLGGFVPDGEELSDHLESRADVGDALSRSPVDLVWLRAAVILGAGSTSYELVRYLAERLPVVPMPRWMRHIVAPIAVDDVLRYLVAAADPAVLPRGSYDISNGETLTYADVIKRYAQVRGLHRAWLDVRWVRPGLAAPVVARLTPIPGDLVADLVQSLANSMSSDDHRIRRYVPDPPDGLTSLTDAIERAALEPSFVPAGVLATADPLQLTDTDPDWAGGDAFRRGRGPAGPRVQPPVPDNSAS
jgi:uncharacterized protein YbjT (DUF2867 family)